MMLIRGLLIAGVLAAPVVAQAATETLTPSQTTRLVNPEDPGDVRLLFRFSLPEGLRGGEILRAWCTIPSRGTKQVLLGVTPFSTTIPRTWNGLVGLLSQGDLDRGLVVANDLEVAEAGIVDRGIEFDCVAAARDWIDGRSDLGFCVQRAPGRSDDVSGVLGMEIAAPMLTVVYLQRE